MTMPEDAGGLTLRHGALVLLLQLGAVGVMQVFAVELGYTPPGDSEMIQSLHVHWLALAICCALVSGLVMSRTLPAVRPRKGDDWRIGGVSALGFAVTVATGWVAAGLTHDGLTLSNAGRLAAIGGLQAAVSAVFGSVIGLRVAAMILIGPQAPPGPPPG